jgi:hypothetical protein
MYGENPYIPTQYSDRVTAQQHQLKASMPSTRKRCPCCRSRDLGTMTVKDNYTGEHLDTRYCSACGWDEIDDLLELEEWE